MSIPSNVIVPQVPAVTFEPPTTFFTVDTGVATAVSGPLSNPRSARVLRAMGRDSAKVCVTAEEALALAGPRSVAVFDYSYGSGEWSPVATDRFEGSCPAWAGNSPWGLVVKPACGANENRINRCAAQVSILFSERIFYDRLAKEMFPWGLPKQGMGGPAEKVVIDEALVGDVVRNLNSGPNLADAIADKAFAAGLPAGSRISWIRVLPEPLAYSRDVMQRLVSVLRTFEQACHRFLKESGPGSRVADMILSGVALREERLRSLYLDPGAECFSISRPDLHWTKVGLRASEIDEMPGGMPELVLIDKAYGHNADGWRKFFDWLTSSGPLVYLVSHQWSRCYIPETAWLVGHLRSLGYDARIVTTDKLDEFSVGPNGVTHLGEKIGTIWRQFPIFETVGKLADIVEAARRGSVRLYPEWAHFGNKAWFSLFWRNLGWFSDNMDHSDFDLLRGIVPESQFVGGYESFPLSVEGIPTIGSVADLCNLPEEARDRLVMKICGANNLAARSYGVLMGKGIKSSDWSQWVRDRLRLQEPFLVQAMFDAGVVSVPVWHTGVSRGEMFRCKVLMRPWALNGDVVSVHACAVPRKYHKVHGMVDMAVSPVRLV